jgi:hypothetical protein
MNNPVNTASGGMIYIPSYIQIKSQIQKLLWGTNIDTYKHIPTQGHRQRAR